MARGWLLLLRLRLFLLLRRGGGVLDWWGATECCRCSCNRRWEWKGWDRGCGSNNWDHWNDSNGDLRGRERGQQRGRRVVRLLTVSIITPSDMVGSDCQGRRGNKLHTSGLCLPVDELLLFALLFLCKKQDAQKKLEVQKIRVDVTCRCDG